MSGDPEVNSISVVYNLCWMVRYHRRQKLKRQQSIQLLGLHLRQALNEAESPEDFERVLVAVVNGLSPRDDTQF